MIADAGAPATAAVPATTDAAAPPRPTRPKRSWSPILLPLAAVVTILAIWELLSAGGIVSPLVLPSPTDVAKSLVEDRALYWTNARTTLVEIFLGSVIGVSLGVIFGVMVALKRSIRAALYPLLVASQSLPVLALAPILVLWLGFGIAPKIVIVVQIIFFPVTVATIQGLTSVSHEVLVFGRSLGASASTIFWKVRVPAMLPYLFGGLKIASSYAAVAAVIGEYTGAEHGLGALMLRANSDYNIPVVFGSVVIVTVIGLTLFGLTSLAERKLTPWHRASTDR
jgi:ABC-type nitrate/sulfonate/bicarbonate transport system permease component